MSNKTHSLKIENLVLHLVTLLFSIAFNGVSTILSQFAVLKFNASPTEVGIIWSSFYIVSFFIRPLAGLLCDHGYRYRLLILGSLLFAFSSLMYFFSTTIEKVLFARLFQGLSQGIFMTSSFSIVACEASFNGKYFEESIAWRSTMLGLGMIIGPAIGGYIVSFYGFDNAFLFIFLIGLTVFSSSLLLIKILKINEEVTFNLKNFHFLKLLKNNFKELWISFLEIIKLTKFRHAIVALFFYSASYIAVTSFLPAYYALKFGEGSGIIIGTCLSIIGISSIIPRVLLTRLLDFYSHKNIAVFSFAFLSISLFLLGLNPTPPAIYLISILIGLNIGIIIPILQIMALIDVKNSRKGVATGFYVQGFDISNFISPLIFGFLGNIFGYDFILKVVFIPILIGLLYMIK